ncbi:hypothetical protein Dda_3001 [Drechslerella dactyloides]|uniref:SnoaL-like domain-containing protein n=1 Tax=Drechslerella dactyloides TaxID=74499 RepID=A0AAD6NJX7_DREDA|nr:hypothetical protein Dda_3001 [Drechslerella dactyloides]
MDAATSTSAGAYDALLAAAKALCDDFAAKADSQTIVSHFSRDATAFEHGSPTFASFLGREFKGRDGVTEYFGLLQRFLEFANMSFSEYFVDERQGRVSVKGKASFTWLSTGVSWDEVFTYVLDFVDEDGGWKVSRYQVWADTGALYLARLGQRAQDISSF